MKEPITNPHLQTWLKLNAYLLTADEETCQKLLDEERQGRNRKQFMKRIHSRLNRVRRVRERAEIAGDES